MDHLTPADSAAMLRPWTPPQLKPIALTSSTLGGITPNFAESTPGGAAS
jgi:hypothetical protein